MHYNITNTIFHVGISYLPNNSRYNLNITYFNIFINHCTKITGSLTASSHYVLIQIFKQRKGMELLNHGIVRRH